FALDLIEPARPVGQDQVQKQVTELQRMPRENRRGNPSLGDLNAQFPQRLMALLVAEPARPDPLYGQRRLAPRVDAPATGILPRHLDPRASHLRGDFRAELQRHPALDWQEIQLDRDRSDICWLIHGGLLRQERRSGFSLTWFRIYFRVRLKPDLLSTQSCGPARLLSDK